MNSTDANPSRTPPIDPAFVAAIVRKVIAQLHHAKKNDSPEDATTAPISDKVVTAGTIESLTGTPTELFVTHNSVVTPAAYDEAKQRGIEIKRTTVPSQQPQPETTSANEQEITDQQHPERAEAVDMQLSKRGINAIGSQIVLSDTPAADVHRWISAHGGRAAMVTGIDDVDRFRQELQPDVWVIDMKRINLIAATNIAARIAQFGN